MSKQVFSKISLLKAIGWKFLWSLKSLVIGLSCGIISPIVLAILIVQFGVTTERNHKNETSTIPMDFNRTLGATYGLLDLLYVSDINETDILIKKVQKMIPPSKLLKVDKKTNEDEMQNWFIDNHKNSNKTMVGIGIIFDKMTETELIYTMKSTSTKFLNTNKQYPKDTGSGPLYAGNFYLENFFISVQIAINTGYIDYLGMNETEVNIHGDLREREDVKEWLLQPFPHPPYEEVSGFQEFRKYLYYLLYGLLVLKLYMISLIIREKSSGARELLLLNGFKRYMIYIYWSLVFIFCSLIISIGLALALKPVLTDTSGFVIFLLFFIFSIADISFALMICEIFESSSTVIILFMAITASAIMGNTKMHYPCYSLLSMIVMLIPSMAALHGIDVMVAFEMKGEGLKIRRNINKIDKSTGRGPYFFIILEMIFSIILYYFISYYINAINPGEFGTAKPWHFIIPNFIKKSCMKEKKKEIEKSSGPKPIIETVKLEPGIIVKNVYKTYGSFNAVNNLSIDLYKNQITALLGHNGAGKTTFFYIITGIRSPTSGEILYEGENVFENISKFRRSIGFCPQIDICIDNLTVQQQIIFFGIAKGLSKQKATEDSIAILNKLGLYEKRNVLPSKLSGGMKRKLNLAIALINNPPILFLDEPTSGLDPESRRNLWDILLTLREGRTIILTTHFMEEADALGDRIAIMAHGEIRCYGSAMFLKKHYGSGYKMIITYKNESPKALEEAVTYFTSGVLISSKGNKLIFNIPIGDTSKMSKMFSTLEGILSNGSSISITTNSSEDIFLKVQEHEGISTAFDEKDVSFFTKPKKKNGAVKRFFQTFVALIKKRLLCYHIGALTFIISIIMIIFGTWLFMYLINKTKTPTNLPELDLDQLDKYQDTIVIISGNQENKIYSAFKSIVAASGVSIKEIKSNTSDELLKIGNEDELEYTYNYFISGDFLKIPTVLFSTVTYHAPAIAVNLIFNALIQSEKPQVNIKTINKPYEFKSEVCTSTVELGASLRSFLWLMFSFFILTSISFFVCFPMLENSSKFKHLQYIAGLHPILYWITNFLFDVILFSITFLLIIGLIIYFMDESNYFRNDIFVAAIFSTLLLAAAMILICYILTLFTNSRGVCLILIVFPAFLLVIIYYILVNNYKIIENFKYILNIDPLFPYIRQVGTINEKGVTKLMCHECIVEESLCQNLSVFSDKEYIDNTIILLFDILFFFILLILLDLKLCQYSCILPKLNKKDENTQEDEDVLEERQVVRDQYGKLQIKGKTSETSDVSVITSVSSKTTDETNETIETIAIDTEKIVLIADRLSRYFRKKRTVFAAAEDISFIGLRGECFGVLGASGAGKSTTFAMLTGTIMPKSGNALIVHNDKLYSLKSVLSFVKNIGYCPQENWVLGNMTARQLMVHFAQLRGIKSDEIKEIVDWWIIMLDLHLYCDKEFAHYSGGNKRKLSTALALIGDPPVILLDEPTTGVDPVTRRKLWQVFRLIEHTDQTMILTSHSMDECEAVCSRLTILKNGRMQCIGEVEYLKKRFALGYTILIKLSDETDVDSLKKKVIANFGKKCVLTDEHAGLLHYHVSEIKFKWSDIFNKMDVLQSSFRFEEYMLSDTTLEQVFMSFSDQQPQK